MSADDDNISLHPHLLSASSRGGLNAQEGFQYQLDLILSRIPYWIANHGFEQLICEGMGDAEAKFFFGLGDYRYEYLEIKDHEIQANEFWDEIDNFKGTALSKENIEYFLFGSSFARRLRPLISSLNRLKNTFSYYGSKSSFFLEAKRHVTNQLKQMKRKSDDAEFLMQFVNIIGMEKGIPPFEQSLIRAFPDYSSLSTQSLQSLRIDLFGVLSKRISVPILRKEIEERIIHHLGPIDHPFNTVDLISADEKLDLVNPIPIRLADDDYNFRESLMKTRSWLVENRKTRVIRVFGKWRLSKAISIGHTFPAATGFSLEIYHRDKVYSTSDFDETSASLAIDHGGGFGREFALSIGVIKDIRNEVEKYVEQTFATDFPWMNVHIPHPLITGAQSNYLVGQIKNELSARLSLTPSTKIHLFINSPTFFAMCLGHRLNSLPDIQCYEWKEGFFYKPSLYLPNTNR